MFDFLLAALPIAILVFVMTKPRPLLALQCAGAAMGNIICIHNIISVCAVLSLSGVEGRILKDALPAVGIYALILVLAAAFLP